MRAWLALAPVWTPGSEDPSCLWVFPVGLQLTSTSDLEGQPCVAHPHPAASSGSELGGSGLQVLLSSSGTHAQWGPGREGPHCLCSHVPLRASWNRLGFLPAASGNGAGRGTPLCPEDPLLPVPSIHLQPKQKTLYVNGVKHFPIRLPKLGPHPLLKRKVGLHK